MQDPWLRMYCIHSTELAKAGEKEVQLQTPVLQKGDGVPDVSNMPSSGAHSSQCTDPPPFLALSSTGSFSISTFVVGRLSQCGLSVPAGRRKQLFCSWLRFLTPSQPNRASGSAITSSCTTLSYHSSAGTWCLGESKQPALGAQPHKMHTREQLTAGTRTRHPRIFSQNVHTHLFLSNNFGNGKGILNEETFSTSWWSPIAFRLPA